MTKCLDGEVAVANARRADAAIAEAVHPQVHDRHAGGAAVGQANARVAADRAGDNGVSGRISMGNR